MANDEIHSSGNKDGTRTESGAGRPGELTVTAERRAGSLLADKDGRQLSNLFPCSPLAAAVPFITSVTFQKAETGRNKVGRLMTQPCQRDQWIGTKYTANYCHLLAGH